MKVVYDFVSSYEIKAVLLNAIYIPVDLKSTFSIQILVPLCDPFQFSEWTSTFQKTFCFHFPTDGHNTLLQYRYIYLPNYTVSHPGLSSHIKNT